MIVIIRLQALFPTFRSLGRQEPFPHHPRHFIGKQAMNPELLGNLYKLSHGPRAIGELVSYITVPEPLQNLYKLYHGSRAIWELVQVISRPQSHCRTCTGYITAPEPFGNLYKLYHGPEPLGNLYKLQML